MVMKTKKFVSGSKFTMLAFTLLVGCAGPTRAPSSDTSTVPTSFAGNQGSTDTSAAEDQLFDKLFPYYTVECSESRGLKNATPKVDANDQAIIGSDGNPEMNSAEEYGAFGHAVMYLKGVCRDTSVTYPKVKMCDPSQVDLANPNSGVGISIDKIFANTKFLVVDGKDAIFSGNLRPDQPLNRTTFNAAVNDVIASGAIDGITIHNPDMKDKPAGMSDEDWMNRQVASSGADTDFALQFARESSCVKIPMDKARMQAEVDEANKENEPYTLHGKVNNWAGASNSCVDFTHNILAAAGFGKEVWHNGSPFVQALALLTFTIVIPRNETVRTLDKTNQVGKISTAEEVYNNPTLRKDFDKFGSLAETGGIFEKIPFHSYENSLYTEASGAEQIGGKKKMAHMMANPAYTDLTANLDRLRAQLVKVQQERKPIAADDSSEEAQFASKYNAWIDNAVTAVDQRKVEIEQAAAADPAGSI
jgi:hypothetical protein